MRILFVSHYFPPFAVGGVEEITLDLAKEMQARGHAVHVFHGVIGRPVPDLSVERHVHEGVPCTAVEVDLAAIDDFAGTWRQPAVESLFNELLDEFRPDVVDVEHLTRLSTGMLGVVRARGIPSVLKLHDYWWQCARGQRMRPDGFLCRDIDHERCASCMALDIDFLDGRRKGSRAREIDAQRGTAARHRAQIELRKREMLAALELPELVAATGAFQLDEYKKWGLRREIGLELVGVDPAIAEGYTPPPVARDVLRIAFLGRVVPTKGLDVAIDAMRLLGRGAKLAIHGAGEPDYVASLVERARGLPIEFTGIYGAQDLVRLFESFDVQLVPSIGFEGAPLVMQKARLFQKPVVVSDTGGTAELVRDGIDSLVFRACDPAHLAERLAWLVEDLSRVERLRDALPAPRLARQHFDAMEAHFERLAARCASRS